MATQYTTNLGLALPVTGELDGTWGDVVNQEITELVEQAIAGMATINTWTTNSHTLTEVDGSSDESRCAILLCDDDGGGNPSAAAQVIVPAKTKLYVVRNLTGQTVTVKTSAGSGVAVINNGIVSVYCDGTNVYSANATATFTSGTISGTAVNPRVVAAADATSITINADTTDEATQANTQAVGTLTINAPTGTPVSGQKLILRITSSNVQTFSWNSAFMGGTDLGLPVGTSGGGLTDYMGFIYNSTASKWQIVGKVFGF